MFIVCFLFLVRCFLVLFPLCSFQLPSSKQANLQIRIGAAGGKFTLSDAEVRTYFGRLSKLNPSFHLVLIGYETGLGRVELVRVQTDIHQLLKLFEEGGSLQPYEEKE